MSDWNVLRSRGKRARDRKGLVAAACAFVLLFEILTPLTDDFILLSPISSPPPSLSESRARLQSRIRTCRRVSRSFGINISRIGGERSWISLGRPNPRVTVNPDHPSTLLRSRHPRTSSDHQVVLLNSPYRLSGLEPRPQSWQTSIYPTPARLRVRSRRFSSASSPRKSRSAWRSSTSNTQRRCM
jgi:hypothetical protein